MSSIANSILESISDGVFTVDLEWRLTSFNRAAERILGIGREDALGKLCWEVFKADMCESECPLRRTLKTGRRIVNKEGCIIDFKGNRIPVSVSTALLLDAKGRITGGAETFRDLREIEELKRELAVRSSLPEEESRSPAMRRILDLLPAVADGPSSVLIEGETGTGKEVLARMIHARSPRASGPFVAVNCGALPDTLLESELFGYRKGAFTGADRNKPGRFELAEGGTLFLDEIGDVSPAMQVKLLRVLQEREYEPLGATGPEKADVRVLAATNRDLAGMVEKGTFRRDLYYRINVVRVSLPPLRERKEDIPRLAEQFLEKFRRTMGKNVRTFAPEVLAAFYAYAWPGNIRELENVVERLVLLSQGRRAELSDLSPEVAAALSPTAGGAALAPVLTPETSMAVSASAAAGDPARTSVPSGEDGADSAQDSTAASSVPEPTERTLQAERRETERRLVLCALERCGWNRTAAARDLGIDKATLYRKIKTLGIELPERDGRSAPGR